MKNKAGRLLRMGTTTRDTEENNFLHRHGGTKFFKANSLNFHETIRALK